MLLASGVDLILIMSVNPGFGGQSFIESQVKKIADLRRMCVELVYTSNLLLSFNSKFILQPKPEAFSSPETIGLWCLLQGVNPWIEVDGGVTPKNAYKVIEAGANALVAGSAVFGAKDYAEGIYISGSSLYYQP